MGMMKRLTDRQEWKFFTALGRADRGPATLWWALLIGRGLLPAGFAIAMGALVGAVPGGRSLTGPLIGVGGAVRGDAGVRAVASYGQRQPR